MLEDVAAEHLALARVDERGRSAVLVVHDGPLRQTVIALRAGTELAEHNAPHAASILVLTGSVRVTGMSPDLVGAGELVALTHERHAVHAVDDTAFLLTTVTGQPGDLADLADAPVPRQGT